MNVSLREKTQVALLRKNVLAGFGGVWLSACVWPVSNIPVSLTLSGVAGNRVTIPVQ